jgi:hypothetical protein
VDNQPQGLQRQPQQQQQQPQQDNQRQPQRQSKLNPYVLPNVLALLQVLDQKQQ